MRGSEARQRRRAQGRAPPRLRRASNAIPRDDAPWVRAELVHGAGGSGALPRARRSHTPAPRSRILPGDGEHLQRRLLPSLSRGTAQGAASPSAAAATGAFTPGPPPGRGWEGSGRRGGEAKCEISHLPRGGRRLPGGCQPALPAASLRRHRCQRHERHRLRGPGSCLGLCRPWHRPRSSCVPPLLALALAAGWPCQTQASPGTAPGACA